MKRDELTAFLDEVLHLREFSSDCSNNGLQVEGSDEVKKAVFGVDASLALIKKAAELSADFIFVHHGFSWGGEPRRLTGISAGRYGALFRNRISLYGAHLPLDAHPTLGHNAQLARFAGVKAELVPFCSYHGILIGCAGELEEPLTATGLVQKLAGKLVSPPAVGIFGATPEKPLKSVGFVSGGGGQEAVSAALEDHLDALVTGEVFHEMYHAIVESGLTVIKLGHYASETPGVEAVRRLVQGELGLETVFVDLPTGL